MVRVPDVAAGEVTVAAEAVIVSTTVVVIDVVAIAIGVDVRTTVYNESVLQLEIKAFCHTGVDRIVTVAWAFVTVKPRPNSIPFAAAIRRIEYVPATSWEWVNGLEGNQPLIYDKCETTDHTDSYSIWSVVI
jgi:hypothetical protein